MHFNYMRLSWVRLFNQLCIYELTITQNKRHFNIEIVDLYHRTSSSSMTCTLYDI